MCRSKLGNPTLISIEYLNIRKERNIVEGGILVVYTTTLDRESRTWEVLCTNLIDFKGEMTITLTFIGNLVQQYKDVIVLGTSISISRCQVAPRTNNDHGDCDYILILK